MRGPLPGGSRRPIAQSDLSVVTRLFVAVIIIAALYIGRSVLIPIALAVLLAFVLTPVVRALRKIGLPTTAAVTSIVVVLLALLIGSGLIVSRQITSLAENIPRYEWSLREKVKALRGATMQGGAVEKAAETIKHLGKELSKPEAKKKSITEPEPLSEGPKLTPVPVTVQAPPATALENYKDIIGTLLEPLTIFGLVFLYLTFILLQRQDLRDRLIRLAGVSDLDRTTTALADAGDRLSRFFLLQAIINLAYGAFVGVALWLIGIPNPILWGGLAFLMRYVPYVGSFLAAGFPLVLAAAVDPSWTTFIWTFAIFGLGEALMGQVVEPMAFGSHTGLSPFAVIVSATLWTSLWGPIGLVLAIPLTLLIVTVSRHIEQLNFLNVMFGDEPALGPAEQFYQRTLANDPDEVTEISEKFLKDQSLLDCYEEVALGALRLAKYDAERGALDNAKLETISEVVAEVVEDLAYIEGPSPLEKSAKLIPERKSDESTVQKDADDVFVVLDDTKLSPGWRIESPLLCISGRSPLDAAAAELTVHLLRTYGINGDSIPYREITTARVGNHQIDGVQAVVLSYVSIGKSTAHIRSLIQRIRRIMPEATIIAGLWGTGDEAGNPKEHPDIGADYTVSTLRDALRVCIKLAANDVVARNTIEMEPVE